MFKWLIVCEVYLYMSQHAHGAEEEGQLKELVLLLPLGFKFRLGDKGLYPLSHFTSLRIARDS